MSASSKIPDMPIWPVVISILPCVDGFVAATSPTVIIGG